MTKRFLITIGIMGALSIILGIFGTQILTDNISDKYMNIFTRGTEYLMFHALALLGLAFVNRYVSRSYMNAIYYFFVIGIALFSGSCFLISIKELAEYNIETLQVLSTIGGIFLIAGWIILIFAGSSYTHNKGKK